MRDAEHEETTPGAPTLLISRLACSLVGKTEVIQIAPGSIAWRAYGKGEASEQFSCSYGLNPELRGGLGPGPLKITGTGPNGEARIVELPAHRFYVATLYLPQVNSRPEGPHALIVAFLKAALDFRVFRRDRDANPY